jgi:hypothetical protein
MIHDAARKNKKMLDHPAVPIQAGHNPESRAWNQTTNSTRTISWQAHCSVRSWIARTGNEKASALVELHQGRS